MDFAHEGVGTLCDSVTTTSLISLLFQHLATPPTQQEVDSLAPPLAREWTSSVTASPVRRQ